MSLAGSTTVIRLALRVRNLWWDDVLAVLALMSLIITAVAGKTYYGITGQCLNFIIYVYEWLTSTLLQFRHQYNTSTLACGIILYLRGHLWYDGVVSKFFDIPHHHHSLTPGPRHRASRLSILLTIIRLGSFQKRLYTAAVCFMLACLILVAQVFWVCEPQDRHNHWKVDAVPQCVLGQSVAITQVTSMYYIISNYHIYT